MTPHHQQFTCASTLNTNTKPPSKYIYIEKKCTLNKKTQNQEWIRIPIENQKFKLDFSSKRPHSLMSFFFSIMVNSNVKKLIIFIIL